MSKVVVSSLKSTVSTLNLGVDLSIPKTTASWDGDGSASTWELDSMNVASYTDTAIGEGYVNWTVYAAVDPEVIYGGVNNQNGNGRSPHRQSSGVDKSYFYNSDNANAPKDASINECIVCHTRLA